MTTQDPSDQPAHTISAAMRKGIADGLDEGLADGLGRGLRRHLPSAVGVVLVGVPLCGLLEFLHAVVGMSLEMTGLSGVAGLGVAQAIRVVVDRRTGDDEQPRRNASDQGDDDASSE